VARDTQIYVVLDANILISDFWLNSQSMTYLKTHSFLQHIPIIPEVVFKEVRNHLKNRAEELLGNTPKGKQRSKGNSVRLLKLFNYTIDSDDNDWGVDNLLNRWDSSIKAFLIEFKGRMLPTVDVKIDDLIQRSINRKKPFSKGDSGFRDSLIWLSTLDLINDSTHVSFVTKNTNDFFETNSSEPHPDLLDDAKDKLGEHRKILFHKSLDDFIVNFDSDRTASAEALERALISNNLSGLNLWDWLEENLADVIGDSEFDGINWAGLPYHAEAPQLYEIEELVSLDIPRVFHALDDIYTVYCDLAFIGYFSAEIAFSKSETIVNPNQILWKDETDSFWTSIGIRSAATFIVKIDIDMKTKKVINPYASPLYHWSSYDDVIESLESEIKELEDMNAEFSEV
jgi:predicted nucleic acid-binding protein